MLKRVNALLKANKEAYRIPRRVQDLIPIRRVWEDGVFQLGQDFYAQTFRFSDVNYLSASKSTQARLKDGYMQLLNSLDPDAMTKITIVSHPLRKGFFAENVLMPDRGDGRDKYRHECNELITGGSSRAIGKEQELYLTVSAKHRNYQDAASFLRIRPICCGTTCGESAPTARLWTPRRSSPCCSASTGPRTRTPSGSTWRTECERGTISGTAFAQTAWRSTATISGSETATVVCFF